MKKAKKFKRGTVVVFDSKVLDKRENLSEEDRIKFYGPLGYGQTKLKLWVFLTEVRNAPGHCVLVDMDGHIEVMRHISDFREVEDGEI